jgi:exopolysaccharide biosynthesis polyprenyl glycosylphosphotransferase
MKLADPGSEAAAPRTQLKAQRGTLTVVADAHADRQPPLTPRRIKVALVTIDVIAVAAGLAFATATQALLRPEPGDVVRNHLALAALTLPLWPLAFACRRLYTARMVATPRDEATRLFQAVVVGIGGVLAAAFLVHMTVLSRFWLGTVALAVLTTTGIERGIGRVVFAHLRRVGRMRRRVVIIGTRREARDLATTLTRRPELGYEVVGLLGDAPTHHERDVPPVLGRLADADPAVRRTGAGGVLIASEDVGAATTNHLTRRLTDAGVHVEVCVSLKDIAVPRCRPKSLGGHAVLYVEPTARDGWRLRAKRVLDITLAAAALLLAAPVLAVAAAAIMLEDGGPVLFRQGRLGQSGHGFKMLKLRTMVADAESRRAEILHMNEADGPLFKIGSDPRITRVGRVLRKLSIDEIPQFWNVLRAEMSVVGPRPALPEERAAWGPDTEERLRVKPGITGVWQVSGRSLTSFEEYERLDRYYVDNWSLAHDLSIVARTVPAVLRRRGAS